MQRQSFRMIWMLLLQLTLAGAALAGLPEIEDAERAIAAGHVDPERDIRPLLDALATSDSVDEKRELVNVIADLGEADGEAPNAVKKFLGENAPPVLLDVIEHGANNFLQGDAVHALRGMNVPRSVLVEAADIAEASSDSYVQSRGEILRNYIRGLPEESAQASIRPADASKAESGTAYLDKRGITISTQALRDAALRADPQAVKALLDAGVPVDTGATDLNQTPIYFAVGVGCHSQGEETDWLIETIQLLVRAGADLSRVDGNRNTVLMSAAQYCGARTINALVAGGARIDVRNGSGVTPLAMALIMSRFDAAEALVSHGARIAEKDRMMVSGVTDARGKAIIAKAMGKR